MGTEEKEDNATGSRHDNGRQEAQGFDKKKDKTRKDPDQDNVAATTRLETLRQQFKRKLFIPQTEKKDRTEEYIEEDEDRKPSLANEVSVCGE